MITPSNIGGDEDLARRIIVLARSIAPCIDTLVDGPGDNDPKPRSDALAILRGVRDEVVARGSRGIASERIGPAAVTYVVNASTFSNDDRAALRALCASSPVPGLPMGSFPASGAVGRVWPEGAYS